MATALAPSSSRLDSNRDALLGGLAFLEASATPDWGVRGLCAWFNDHLVTPGYMMAPLLVTETSVGTLLLHGHGSGAAPDLGRILATARSRVLTTLKGLLASPPDDRFLSAAIFAGHVWRKRIDGASRWVARPQPTTPLSGIVLSLFAVDVLSHREIYTQLLSICETCDLVSFHDGARRSCLGHQPSVSGFTRAVSQRAGERAGSGRG